MNFRKAILGAAIVSMLVPSMAGAQARRQQPQQKGNESGLKTETFDRDPGWEGVNNRSARDPKNQREVRQDFGWSKSTSHAGGDKGELGGHISPAGEVAYYATEMPTKTFDDKLTASGTMWVGPGGTHLLLGFFNAETAKEWRTNNSINLRINPRDDKQFFAYADYCTSTWRAGGQLFTHDPNPTSSRAEQTSFEVGRVYEWTLTYDPEGNNGGGTVTATIGDETSVCNLDTGHKADGATFTHFGIMNVAKSADSGSEFFIDNLTVLDRTETFDRDPQWDAKNNKTTYKSAIVRPLFDFGYSPDTNFAGGKKTGEIGGQIFRGDCRYPERMACYGDVVGPLTLDKPLKASGKITMTRGVTDTGVLFGFYNRQQSMRVNDSQENGIPESFLGIHLEGPSREGFKFYPIWRAKDGASGYGNYEEAPYILPDGTSHDWAIEYDPNGGAEGHGQIKVTYDGTTRTYDLEEGIKQSGTTFDRFGIVTSWIDGNSEDVYWDDLTYTAAQQ